uniref:protein TOO MANY MOUTHS n=1 Tax=Erigeron canadensis TaxID=72917 RepID=UPI001CB96D33|nr:protein TOO MANY MOUTHS [Erigeron canadensis]
MAFSSTPTFCFTFTFTFLFTTLTTTSLQLGNSQPILNSVEQESVYQVLESLNSNISWRSLFPDDLCLSGPHGVVCDYITITQTLHIVELNFGVVSDFDPNPTCTPNSTLPDPVLFSNFPHLRKLFFYQCFTHKPVSLPDFYRVGSGFEELVFIDNPGLFGSLSDNFGGMKSLRRLIITGSNVSGEIPVGFGELINLEEATLSRNGFTGVLPGNLSKLEKLKILDFSQNGFTGKVPGSIDGLKNLLKIDLSYNKFSGEIPAKMEGLRGLEFLDLSYNRFVGCGVPLFLGNMSKLKGVYLSGNELGGVIPDIWENLRGINGIGLSGVGLIGVIPTSMGAYLGNLSYLALDNNNLIGEVPKEFEKLGMLNELDLSNNSLSGKLPFSKEFMVKVGKKLKVEGNLELCMDEGVIKSFNKVSGYLGQVKVCSKIEDPRYAFLYGTSSSTRNSGHVYCLLVLFILLL